MDVWNKISPPTSKADNSASESLTKTGLTFLESAYTQLFGAPSSRSYERRKGAEYAIRGGDRTAITQFRKISKLRK